MSIPISLGISASRAQSDLSGGPFDVQSDIVFSGGSAANSPYQGYSPDVTQTPTAEATGTGSILPAGTGSILPAGTTGTVTGTAGGTSMTTWLILGAVVIGGYLWWKNNH